MSIKRLMMEESEISNDDTLSQFMNAGHVGDDWFDWNAMILGPQNSPYSGGVFQLKIRFTQDYPFKAPKVTFMTKVYHCNINEKGGICLDLLKDQWSPAIKISKLLLSIQSLLTTPNINSPLMPKIAQLYHQNKHQHDRTAAEWTQRYAT
eukprot:78910_1